MGKDRDVGIYFYQGVANFCGKTVVWEGVIKKKGGL